MRADMLTRGRVSRVWRDLGPLTQRFLSGAAAQGDGVAIEIPPPSKLAGMPARQANAPVVVATLKADGGLVLCVDFDPPWPLNRTNPLERA